MRRAWLLLAALVLATSTATAVPRRAPGVALRRVTPVRRRAVAPPPRPTLDLQVSGLIPGARRFHAVMHAIQRDAVPALSACVAQTPGARGTASVTLTPARRGAVRAELQSAMPSALVECLRVAAGRVVLPPLELVDDERAEGDEGVRFELRVRLPAVGLR